MTMEHNVGGTEKNVRLAVGIAAIAVGLFGGLGRSVKISMLSLGGIQLATALSGYCPVNQMLGRNSYAPSLPLAVEKAMEQTRHFAE